MAGENVLGNDSLGVSVEHIMLFQIEEIVTEYDQKVFQCIIAKETERCEEYLTAFCMALLDLSDQEQVFVARIFFVGIVTEVIRVKKRKKTLYPKTLSQAYALIAQVEKWENLSEYILAIPSYLKQLIEEVIAEQPMLEQSIYVEKAIKIIHENLTNPALNVSWVAQQLDLSTTHIANIFKIELDQTISKYILKQKLNEITYAIRYTNKTLTEIREAYGIVNQSHFIQQFKKHIGMTPLQYKKEL